MYSIYVCIEHKEYEGRTYKLPIYGLFYLHLHNYDEYMNVTHRW
jgi:hypothetical protein